MQIQKTLMLVLPVLLSSCARGQTPSAEPAPAAESPQERTPAATATTRGPTIGKCPVFPADNIWNTRVDHFPVDPHSSAFIQSIGADKGLHPDFGRDPKSGIPINVVSGKPGKVDVHPVEGKDESDAGPAPIPTNPSLEGGGEGDSHLIVVDTDDCRLYELFAAKREPGGAWHAYSSAYYDLRSNALRPDGWTSADAAGLPILPGLVRYEEVAAGEIRHAIRFTAPKTRRSYVWPARHWASKSDDPALPPMGTRMRLRADFDISGFSKEAQVILRALKTYGMLLSDNGGPWFMTGAPNPNWDPDRLTAELRKVVGSNFEVVDTLAAIRGPNSGAAVEPPPATSTALRGPSIGKCPVFPADNIWNTPVAKLPLDPHSSAYIQSIGADKTLHADFGRDPKSGIPINVVSGKPGKVDVHPVEGKDESDAGPAPIPANPSIEGGEDGHMIVVDTDDCRLYELFLAKREAAGSWRTYSSAFYDLRSNTLRPDGWTSADAAGLPIFPGLVRYEEVAAGEIRHAIRFTAPKTRRSYAWPARHYASRSDDPTLPPMGTRVRLRADFDISGFSKQVQVILRALKTYGMILSDNGGPWFITGAPNANWDDGTRIAEEMRRIPGSNFEVVDTSSLMRTPDSGVAIEQAPAGGAAATGGPSIAKCPVLPADNIWNTPIDRLPTDPRSGILVNSIGLDKPLHPDFGNEPTSGMPYNVLSGNPPKVTIKVTPDESDTGPMPVPPNPRIEGGEDAHMIVIDPNDCRLYELFLAKPVASGGWQAYSAAYFDLRSNALRPDGWTSSNAAGLPNFPGLVRYDEVAAGEIRHAIRFTAPKTRRTFVWPARHYASRSDDPALPPMGMRVRLKADFDISGFSAATQVILRALKKYGMMLSDNGSPWFITGAPDPHWDVNHMVEEMRRVKGSDFEVVDTSPLMQGPNSGAALKP